MGSYVIARLRMSCTYVCTRTGKTEKLVVMTDKIASNENVKTAPGGKDEL